MLSNPSCSAAAPLSCDVVDQDCGVAGYGCYGPNAGFCSKAGSLKSGQPCLGNLPAECVAGAWCIESLDTRGAFVCADYCDLNDATSAKACSSFCRGNYTSTSSRVGDKPVAYCEAHNGAVCDPLAPQCPTGQGCYESYCLPAGR